MSASHRVRNGHEPKTWRVALDFGTTFSSVTFCLPYTSVPGLKGGTIVMVDKWPSEVMTAERSYQRSRKSSVPTCLRYEEAGTKAGWQAHYSELGSAKRQAPGLFVSRFKLLLDNGAHTADLREDIEKTVSMLPQPKTDVEIIADYLEPVFALTLERLKQHGLHDRDEVEMVISVPAIWSPMAVRKMYRAIDIACAASGLPIGDTRRTVSEPEASMAYVLEKHPDLDLQDGDSILICDVGGGTTDVVSYFLDGERPREIVASNGCLCGSTSLDERFRQKLVDDLIALNIPNLDMDSKLMRFHIARATSQWAIHHKPTTRMGKNMEGSVTFPLPEASRNEFDNFDGDDYTFSWETISSIYDPVVKQVWDVIKLQLDRMNECGSPAETIIMVGGFSESPYLEEFVRRKCKSYQGQSKPPVPLFPVNCQFSVVEGAMLWANNLNYQADRISRYSVGICRHMPYEPRKPHHKGITPDIDDCGRKYVRNCLEWVIKKNSRIPHTGKTEYLDLHIDVALDTPTVILEQDIFISNTNSKDNYRKTHPINTDVELIERVTFKIDMATILPSLTPVAAPRPKSRAKKTAAPRPKKRAKKTRHPQPILDKYYRVKYKFAITITDLALSYEVRCTGTSQVETGNVPLSYIFQPGVVARSEDDD